MSEQAAQNTHRATQLVRLVTWWEKLSWMDRELLIETADDMSTLGRYLAAESLHKRVCGRFGAATVPADSGDVNIAADPCIQAGVIQVAMEGSMERGLRVVAERIT